MLNYHPVTLTQAHQPYEKKLDSLMTRTKILRDAVIHPEFREDLEYWVRTERKTALRIFKLMEAVMRDPFTGLGQLEPLKHFRI